MFQQKAKIPVNDLSPCKLIILRESNEKCESKLPKARKCGMWDKKKKAGETSQHVTFSILFWLNEIEKGFYF